MNALPISRLRLGAATARTAAAASRGVTLLELMVVIAIVAIAVALAAPSMREMIQMQRLRAANAQLVTDMQFARSESATRQRSVYVDFKPDAVGMSCYTIHTCATSSACQCNCAAAEGSRCSAGSTDIRTVQHKDELGVKLSPADTPTRTAPPQIYFEPATGTMRGQNYWALGPMPPSIGEAWIAASLIGAPSPVPTLRTMIGESGRPSVCSPGGSVSGVTACP